MEKVVSDSNQNLVDFYYFDPELNTHENLFEYYYFDPDLYTDEKNCLIPNKLSGAYSEFKSFIKSKKIPEYAKEYKREYLFIKGLNYYLSQFSKKLEDLNNGLFETKLAKEIKYYMKSFIRKQKENKFKDISNLILPDNFLNHIKFINEQFGFYKLRYDAFCDDDEDNNVYLSDSSSDDDDVDYSDEYKEYLSKINSKKEYLVDGKPYPGFIEFYDIFKQIYNQIKQDDYSDEYESDYYDSDIDCYYSDDDF